MAPSRSRSRERDRDSDRHRSSSRRERSRSRDRGGSSRHSSRRDRSRSRERRRSSSRDRGRDRGSDRRSNFSDPDAASAIQQLQQQQLQKQLLAQQLLMQQQQMAGGGGLSSNKKQREVYVGNLTIGVVADVMLRELFNGALAHLVPDPVANPPVVNAQLDPSGRFGFVEMRSEELATSGMALDKVELCGRHINVGRPKGYVEPPQGAQPSGNLGMAQVFASQISNAPTRILLLENMLKASNLRDPQERSEVAEDVRDESSKCGNVEAMALPIPPPSVSGGEPGRVYIKFTSSDQCQKAKDMFDGRQFDGNTIGAKFVSDEDFLRAAQGEWVMPRSATSMAGPPGDFGLTMGGPLPSGISGMAALNPNALTMHANPSLASLMNASIDPAAVPEQEGWVKLRGIPFTSTKADIIHFFHGCGGAMDEQKVKLVMGLDGRPTGEAYVEISGPGAKYRLALAKDRQLMPNSSRYVEIFTSNREEVDRRLLTGVMLY
ncbi:hypothetical protein WJX74_001008 [Apatococcus lobatus]|uniref:RRM domain-containing protein n=2 Tax=Apatococcus TaxID=904362 RepID=A0AAW1SRY3_9CHLO